MIVKKVNRYYCEFCKKSTGTKYSMGIHELHCTMNLNRVCRMCKRLGKIQVAMPKLLAFFPENAMMFPVWINGHFSPETEVYSKLVLRAISEIKKTAESCPICLFSALRQSGIDPIFWGNFDYQAELTMTLNGLERWEGEY
jgi:hypothetical protein